MTVLKKSISLNPGESKAVYFTFIPSQARVHQVSIDGLSGSFRAISLPEATGLYGIVKDAQTGAPLSMVLVSIAAPYEQSTFTDIGGYYVFPSLQPGNYTVYFNKDGYWVERVPLTFTQAPYQLNVELTPISAGVAHFVSCEVPAQIGRGTIPQTMGEMATTQEFSASHRLYLTAQADKLYTFELLADKTGVAINPTEYARPWYGISEENVQWLWDHILYLPSPAQRTQLFPVESDDFYMGQGVANWGGETTLAGLYWNCSTVSVFPWFVPPPPGIYKIVSQCSIVSCALEKVGEGYTIRTWGQWVTLWTVDTGKTIQIV